MATPREGHGQRRFTVSESFIESRLKEHGEFPDDARLLSLHDDTESLKFEVVMESSEWDGMMEGEVIRRGSADD